MNILSGIANAKVPIWEKLWQKIAYKNKFCTMCDNKFQHPVDGREGIFFSIDICDSVQIVAETRENKVLLVRQFRFGSEKLSLELPAGRMEKDEDIIACARRELLEETGYDGKNARIIATLHQNPAVQVNKTHIVHMEKCEQISQPHFDEMEELATLIVPKDELINLIRSDEIDNSLTLSAMAKFLF
ncbi:MAG: NUDIX hydrolase [Puniceicoccales bacterium]|jgi:8-oxo-dGTP pyrophosphatase MutT (NUDIX family)|nr:NUDIX hydrolase [Puniceicoccales bacterium]